MLMIQKDKIYHIVACCILAMYRVDVAIVAAITKEYADSKSPNNKWDWLDILADVVGIIIGVLIRVYVFDIFGFMADLIMYIISPLLNLFGWTLQL